MSAPPEPDASLRERLARLPDPVALLEALFAHSPVPYIIFQADGHPLLTNRAYRAMFAAEPPAEYNVLRDEVIQRIGIADGVRRAFAGEPVESPVIWYDPKELRHIQVTDARRVAISCSFFPLKDAEDRVAYVGIAFKDVTAELEARERAEDERRRLHDILMQAPVAISLRRGPEQVFTFANPLCEQLAGGRPLLGQPAAEAPLPPVVHPRDLDRVYQTGEPVSGTEARVQLTGGEEMFVNFTYQPLKDAQGRVESVVSFAIEVTDQVRARRQAEELARALRESEARYRSFVGQSTEGIWRFELEIPLPVNVPAEEQLNAFYQHGYLAECNDAMARMYGYERAEELNGKRLGELLMQSDPRNREYLLAFIAAGYRLENAESYELDRQGRWRVFQNSLVGTIEEGRLLRAWGTQRDVTAQVEARQQAEAANRAKDEFLAMLGHELRNPLSPILTALELMKLRDASAFSRERAIIERQVRHVVRLVDDLLDVSRMTRGKVSLERQRVEIADSVASAIELASPLLEQRAHRLSVNVPRGLVVDGDATRLGQVFANLLTNAAKYTPHGGQVTVAAERQGARVRVSVRDTGMGIRPEILPRIFDLFVQERQALDRSQGGLGLGLAIVRSLVSLHGGSVEARSEGPGRGSEFAVYLPLSAAVASAESPCEAPAPDPISNGARVLVVDDNEDAADLLAEALTAWGHRVRVAHDGPSALRLLEEFTPEIALLDIGLPVMDGYELARRLKAHPGLSHVRLLAVTGYGQAKDRAAAEEAGFEGHFVKPVDLAALERALVTRSV